VNVAWRFESDMVAFPVGVRHQSPGKLSKSRVFLPTETEYTQVLRQTRPVIGPHRRHGNQWELDGYVIAGQSHFSPRSGNNARRAP
jgi:hypothetical protein